MTYTAKVSQKGWIVIPAELRRRYGIDAGMVVRLVPEEDGIEVIPAMKDAVRETAGKYRLPGVSLTEQLLKERRKDRAREDRRLRGR